jgi:hypothetical protein
LHEVIDNHCKEIFRNRTKLDFIIEHQKEKIDEALKLVDRETIDGLQRDRLADMLADLDGDLLKKIENVKLIKESLEILKKEIDGKDLSFSTQRIGDQKGGYVYFKGKEYKLTPSLLTMAEHLYEQHQNGNYWVEVKDILDKTGAKNINNLKKSNEKPHPAFYLLFDSKGKGAKSVWRIKF